MVLVLAYLYVISLLLKANTVSIENWLKFALFCYGGITGMSDLEQLKENTHLYDKYFQINIFKNTSNNYNVLHTHWHDNFEIILMTAGEAVFDIGNLSACASKGDIVFVNSKQIHTGYSVNNTNVSFDAIVFNKTLIGTEAPDSGNLKYIKPFIEGQFHLPLVINKQDVNHSYFFRLITDIIQEFTNKDRGFEVMIRSYLYNLLIGIVRNYIPENVSLDSSKLFRSNLDEFGKLLNFIKEHYHEKITVSQAANIVNLSPFHFCKSFKRLTGRTFVEFINLYRVNEAEELLRTTNLSVTMVAEKVGFCNINYFDRVFKDFKRYSPSKCRIKNA